MSGQKLGPKDKSYTKPCEPSKRHSFDPVLMKLCQNVYLHEIYLRYETRFHGSDTRSPGQILEKNMCTLQKAQFKGNLHETLSVYLSQLNLGWDQIWVMSGQKLGHKVKLKIKHVNSLEGIVLIQSSWNYVKMFLII